VRQGLTILIAVLLCACGEGSSQAPPPSVWKTQTGTLDKARQVEGIVQAQAETQRRQLDSMSQ
jgi:hypothetical protein